MYFIQHFSTPGTHVVLLLWYHLLSLQALVFPKIILAGRLPAQQNATVISPFLLQFQFVLFVVVDLLTAVLISLHSIIAVHHPINKFNAAVNATYY